MDVSKKGRKHTSLGAALESNGFCQKIPMSKKIACQSERKLGMSLSKWTGQRLPSRAKMMAGYQAESKALMISKIAAAQTCLSAEAISMKLRVSCGLRR